MNRETVYLAALLKNLPDTKRLFNQYLPDYPGEYDEILEYASKLIFFNEEGASMQLTSILNKLANTGDVPKTIPFVPLTISEACFRKDTEELDWNYPDKFTKALALLDANHPDFSDHLFELIKFYFSNYPSFKGLDNVSLFEYIKSHCAFLHCLLDEQRDMQYPFLLVCGDLSGIQNFIYDIHRSKAYKSIKGRSFFLQLVIEETITHILEAAEVPRCNIVYSSGGKFYILLPNTIAIKSAIDDIELQLTNVLFDGVFQGLYTCFGNIPFNIDLNHNYSISSPELHVSGESIEGIGDLWKAVSEKAAQKKSLRYASLIKSEERFLQLFRGALQEDYNGDGMIPCAVTGIPVAEIEDNNIVLRKEEEAIYVHPKVKEQIILGESLRDADVIGWSQTKQLNFIQPLDSPEHWFGLVCEPTQNIEHRILNPADESSYLQYIRRYKATSFTFYGGNKQAISESGEIKNLNDIAVPNEDFSFRKIAVLRMDIDNLGDIFTHKMKRDLGVFAALSDLSARLDWFFSGYINSIRNKPMYEKYVNVLYAGGDDLCVAGRWDRVLEFAQEVRKAFAEYVGSWSGVTLSGGYAIFNPKFPISKAISMAGEALENAKQYKKNKNTSIPHKNAFHLLGTSISWEEEWPFVWQLKELFLTWLHSGIMSKGTVYRLHNFNRLREEGQIDWHWQAAYYFAKMNKQELLPLKKALITGDFIVGEIKYETKPSRMMELIVLAAKMADYYNR